MRFTITTQHTVFTYIYFPAEFISRPLRPHPLFMGLIQAAKNEHILKASHSVGEANYHIQITVAYRQSVFTDPETKILTRDYILVAARRHGITVSAIGFGTDHCHVFRTSCKNICTKMCNIEAMLSVNRS